MKIALVGPSKSGKTVYFTGLYMQFRNSMAFLPLTEERKARYRKMNADKRLRFRIGIDKPALERELRDNSEKLNKRPIEANDWPPPTEELNNADVNVHLDFERISKKDDGSDSEHFHREISIYDPPGEVMSGRHDESSEIIGSLSKCDILMIMLPSDKLIEIFKDHDKEYDSDEDINRMISDALYLGKIDEMIASVREKLPEGDILPICLLITKADQIQLHENATQFINQRLYNDIIIPFSKRPGNENIMVCTCPVSILNPKRNVFSPMNLEWPFLFSLGGTILRNSQILMHESDNFEESAQEAEAEVERIAGLGFWKRNFLFLRKARHRRAALQNRSIAGRKIRESRDDEQLAKNVWATLATEAKANGVRIFKAGEELEDPRTVI